MEWNQNLPTSSAFVLSFHRTFSHIFLGNHQDVFGRLRVCFCQQWLFLWNLPWMPFFPQFLSYWIMNFDLNWETWGLPFVRCCSWFFCDLLVESSILNFGRFHHCFKFSSFVKYTWEPWCYDFWDLLNNFTFSHRFCLNEFLINRCGVNQVWDWLVNLKSFFLKNVVNLT